jgi:2-methylisocitrate lyase-like PEP mutase family enzyme
MPKISIRQLIATEKPLVSPLAHDALSARLIERAGFKSIAVGGSALLAARYALPDIGLAAFGEMLAGIRDIISATDLPLVVDGDDGYGDVKSVAHMMETFLQIGVSGVVLEDQMLVAKQPGDSGATAVVSVQTMVDKIKVAVATCADTEMQLIARCDAYKLEGLPAAMRRAERYLAAGAHGLFIPGLASVADLAEVGKQFKGVHLMTAQFEGRPTWLAPAQYYEMGYRQLTLPGLMIPRLVNCMDETLQQLKRFMETGEPISPYPNESAQKALEQALKFDKWKSFPEGR